MVVLLSSALTTQYHITFAKSRDYSRLFQTIFQPLKPPNFPMSPRLCARKPLFHRHFRDFMRNHGDRGLKFAQQSRLTASWIFRTKEAQNAQKSHKIAHFCSALLCKVLCEAAQCRLAYSCLIFDRRKSGCRGNADSLYFFFSVGNLLLSLIFLWLRISEATHKEFLRYSKSEAR